MNKNSTLRDIIDAARSLSLGITFYPEEKQKNIEIEDKHGKNHVSFLVTDNNYMEIIEYLAERLDQPTIKKLEDYKVFEHKFENIISSHYQAQRLKVSEEKYIVFSVYSRTEYFDTAKELYEWMERETHIETWHEIK